MSKTIRAGAAALIALSSVVGLSQVALAQAPGDPQAGLQLARQWCAECHVISRDQTRAPNAGVPTWPNIADDPGTTEFRLRAFFQTPHQNMPNIALSRQQTDDLITYILSLKRR